MNEKKQIIKYSLGTLIWGYSVGVGSSLIIASLSPSTRFGFTLFAFVWILLFYLHSQWRYTQIEINEEEIIQTYLISFFLKKRTFQLSEIELAFFQFHTSKYGESFVFLYMKNTKRYKIYMWKHELEQIKYGLKNANVPVRNARYLGDRP